MPVNSVWGASGTIGDKPLVHTIDPRVAPGGFSHAWAIETHGTAWAGQVHYAHRLSIPSHVDFARGDLLVWVGQPASGEDGLLDWAKDVLERSALHRLFAIRSAKNRVAALTAHGAMRCLLGAALDVDPRSLTFETDRRGKPHLPKDQPGRLAFNLSHTADRAMVAIAASNVGVDTEYRKPFDDMLTVAEMVFPKELVAELKQCSGISRTALFYRHWCLSEALLKVTGHGLPRGCSEFLFNGHGDDTLRWVAPEFGQLDQWHFGSL